MKLLHLTIALTITFSQSALARPRHAARSVMGALQNILGPYGANQIRAQNQRLALEELSPNVRVVQPKNPYQPDIIYSNVPKMAAPVVPTLPMQAPVVPALPTPIVPTLPMTAPVVPIAREVAYPVQERCPCAAPAPLISPFLPSASPVSPWAPPTSNLLPPVQPSQSRSQFLRKIPIPPPTL